MELPWLTGNAWVISFSLIVFLLPHSIFGCSRFLPWCWHYLDLHSLHVAPKSVGLYLNAFSRECAPASSCSRYGLMLGGYPTLILPYALSQPALPKEPVPYYRARQALDCSTLHYTSISFQPP